MEKNSTSRLDEMKEMQRQESANQMKEMREMESRLKEIVENQTINFERKLKESVAELESKLDSTVNHLENQIDKKVCLVEKKLESQIKTTEIMVTEKVQEIDNRIGVIQERLDSKLGENSEEIDTKLGKMQDKLEEKGNTIDSKLERIQEELKKRLDELNLNSPSTVSNPENSISACSENSICNHSSEQISPRSWNLSATDVTLPKFNNENGQNPLRFIRDLENYFEIRSVPEQLKLVIVRNCLHGNAGNWFEMLNTRETIYSEFRRKFLEHYWDRHRQEEIKLKLTSGKFKPNGHLKMADYFIQVGQQARLLDPPIAPEELVNIVANHFAPEIRSAIIVSRPRTCEQMVNLLKELQGTQNSPASAIDQGESRRTYNFGRDGAGYPNNRDRTNHARFQGPNSRDSPNPGQTHPNRNWNRGNTGDSPSQNNGNTWNRGGHGNTRINNWENNQRPVEQNSRRIDDRRWSPRINFLNMNQRPRPYNRGNGGHGISNHWGQDERDPGHYTDNQNRHVSGGEERPFPPGIDGDRVNHLINTRNTRPPSPSQGRNQTDQPSEN